MPGKIQEIPFKKGNLIKEGQTLLIMSAMKMEYAFKAESKGKIKKVHCRESDTVEENKLLLEVDYSSDSNPS